MEWPWPELATALFQVHAGTNDRQGDGNKLSARLLVFNVCIHCFVCPGVVNLVL